MAQWPKYRMVVDGEAQWMTLREAGITFDSGWVPIEIGGQVLEEDASVRDITPGERARIADIADEWSASK